MLGPALCITAVFESDAAQAHARGCAPVSTMWEKFEPAVIKAAIRTAWPTTIKASPAAGTGPLRRARLSASARGRAAAGAAHQPSQEGQSQISTAYSAQLVTAAAVYAVLWLITKAAGPKGSQLPALTHSSCPLLTVEAQRVGAVGGDADVLQLVEERQHRDVGAERPAAGAATDRQRDPCHADACAHAPPLA